MACDTLTDMRVVLFGMFLLLAASSPMRAEQLTVFAASSLTNVLGDVATSWAARGHALPRLAFAASSKLALQIEQGAPANLFASADEKWMNELDQRGLLAAGTRRDLLSNRLVLVMARERAREVPSGADLASLLAPPWLGSADRLAVGDPAYVPAGRYAAQALRHLGAWDRLGPRLARAENVRAALLFVQRGEAPAGIVYATDAPLAPDVAVVAAFPEESHDPIIYPFAIPKAGDTQQARAFLDFLSGPEARAIFLRYHFQPR